MSSPERVRAEIARKAAQIGAIDRADVNAYGWMAVADGIVTGMSDDQRRLALVALAKSDPEVFRRVAKHGVRFGGVL